MHVTRRSILADDVLKCGPCPRTELMRRREFIAALGGAAAWPVVTGAQQPSRKVRIGALLPGTPASYSPRTNALLEGLRDLGYEEGKTVTIEWKWWNDQVERLPELAAELVSLDVQAIVTAGTPATKALKNATRSIPIIMAVIGDPVAAGLVDSLAHPGRNVTGFSILASDLSGKRLELLKEVVPRLFSVGVILNPANPQPKIELKEIEAAARVLGRTNPPNSDLGRKFVAKFVRKYFERPLGPSRNRSDGCPSL